MPVYLMVLALGTAMTMASTPDGIIERWVVRPEKNRMFELGIPANYAAANVPS